MREFLRSLRTKPAQREINKVWDPDRGERVPKIELNLERLEKWKEFWGKWGINVGKFNPKQAVQVFARYIDKPENKGCGLALFRVERIDEEKGIKNYTTLKLEFSSPRDSIARTDSDTFIYIESMDIAEVKGLHLRMNASSYSCSLGDHLDRSWKMDVVIRNVRSISTGDKRVIFEGDDGRNLIVDHLGNLFTDKVR